VPDAVVKLEGNEKGRLLLKMARLVAAFRSKINVQVVRHGMQPLHSCQYPLESLSFTYKNRFACAWEQIFIAADEIRPFLMQQNGTADDPWGVVRRVLVACCKKNQIRDYTNESA
jgi:hypothetical protein